MPLVPPGAGFFCPPDFPRCHQGAGNSEQGGQTEVAAKVPPEACPIVGESQHIDGVGQRRGDLHHAALAGGAAAVLGVIPGQLAQHHLRQGQQQGAHPDDRQLGRRGGAVLDHLVVHLHVGGGTEPVYAESAQRERGHSQRGHLGRSESNTG